MLIILKKKEIKEINGKISILNATSLKLYSPNRRSRNSVENIRRSGKNFKFRKILGIGISGKISRSTSCQFIFSWYKVKKLKRGQIFDKNSRNKNFLPNFIYLSIFFLGYLSFLCFFYTNLFRLLFLIFLNILFNI